MVNYMIKWENFKKDTDVIRVSFNRIILDVHFLFTLWKIFPYMSQNLASDSKKMLKNQKLWQRES